MSFDRWFHMNYKDFHQSPIQKFQNQKLFLTEENAYSKSDNIYRYFVRLCIKISKNNQNEPPKYLQSKIVANKIIARLNNDKIE